MFKIKEYNKNDVYMLGNGESGHEAVVKYFPGVESFTHIVETDEGGEIAYAIQLLSAMRSQFNVDPALSKSEAIAEIERIRNLPQPEMPVSAEERIAAALEFQNLMSM